MNIEDKGVSGSNFSGSKESPFMRSSMLQPRLKDGVVQGVRELPGIEEEKKLIESSSDGCKRGGVAVLVPLPRGVVGADEQSARVEINVASLDLDLQLILVSPLLELKSGAVPTIEVIENDV